MGRTKKKQPNEENADSLNDFDEDVPDEVHDRFLENLKQFHGKPKINPATRNEPAVEVSEFNFQLKKKIDSTKSAFCEDDLIRAIKKKQPKVAQKLEAVKKSKTLSKNLETVYEKRIQREIGFQNVKNRLNRWKDVVQGNRVTDQITFPLKNRKIEVFDHSENELFSSFSEPTPLEKELAKVLNSSDVAKEDKQKVEQSKFRLTLNEMIEKRKMLSKVKAQASYKIAKARRQNKIKSKKYHRILRNEKTKQQLKDFEILQKTDPEAALKQLESLEKSRAEERATLRHRNTGKWARNQIIKAKYNKESRIALSEQLSKNRELTQKLQKSHDGESDEESVVSDVDTNFAQHSSSSDPNNPWIADTNEYAQFITNYKKFWEEKKNENESESVYKENTITNACKKGTSSCSSAEIKVETKPMSKEFAALKSKKKPTSSKLKKTVDKEITDDDIIKGTTKIVNSSGSWTVTESSIQKNATTGVEKSRKKKNRSKSNVGLDVNVGQIFHSLDENINRNLRKKLNKIQKINENFEDGEKKKKKRKRRSVTLDNQKLGTISNETSNERLQPETTRNNDIDPNKYLKVTPKRLATEIPDLITGGDDAIDDVENDVNTDLQYRMTISEAFAEDDVVAEFQEEKKMVEAESEPQTVDLSLPGWGSWTGASTMERNQTQKAKRPRMNKRLLFKLPKVPPRKDSNKGHVIINEEKNNKFKEHLVSELPHPFTQVKDYEASVRAPIGRTWLPETAHEQLIAPNVVTKLGTVIEPMDEGELINRE